MKDILHFLEQLEINNNRDRFHTHQDDYQATRKQVVALADRLIIAIGDFFELPYDMKGSSCIFRINRDTRFSKDKTPYKNNFGIEISQSGKRQGMPCFYLHIQPGNNSFIAAGLYMPDSKITEAVRQEIDKNGKIFKSIIHKIIKSKQFYLYEEAVKTSPRGYKKDNPNIDLIKLKHRIFERQLKDNDLLKPDFETTIIKQFKELTPFVERLQNGIFYTTKN